MVTKPAHVLVITPHPDDAEFGVAGTVVHWVREGKDVVYLVCTNGDKGTSDPNMHPENLARIREQEQLAAAKLLGVREVIFLRHSDQGLEDIPPFRKQLVRFIRIYQPEIVVTSDPYRRYLWHRDHRITGQVVLDAIFPYARDYHAYPEMILQGLMPHKVQEVLLWASENPNYCSDITDTFDIKMAALNCHKSQVAHIRGDLLEKWLRQLCEEMATGQVYALAEAFHREAMLY